MTRKFATKPTVPGMPGPLIINSELQRAVSIRTVQKPARVSVGGAWDAIGGLANVHGDAYGFSNAVNGIWWEYDVVLRANTPNCCWALVSVHYKGTAYGIIQYTVDGLDTLTVDEYSAAAVRGATAAAYVGGTPAYVTTAPKKITVRIACSGKNASSSGYLIVPLSFGFIEGLIP